MKQSDSLLRLIKAVKIYNELDETPSPRGLALNLIAIDEKFDEVIGILRKQLSKPEIRTSRFPLIIDFEKGTDLDYWFSCKFFNDISPEESAALKEKVVLMVNMLKKLEIMLNQVDPDFARQFFGHMTARVKKHEMLPYEVWRSDCNHLTLKRIKGMAVQLMYDLLNEGVLDFDESPSGEEKAAVKLYLWKKYLKEGTKIPKNFRVRAAKLKRYVHWEANIMLIIDYPSILYKLYKICFNRFTPDQRWAIFDFEAQMKMLRQDLLALKPELLKYLNGSREERKKEKKGSAARKATPKAAVTYIINKVDQFNAVLGNRAEINH